MTKESMLLKLNRPDLNGVGAIATTPEGTKQYYFYEDFENDKGIDRAQRQFDYFINLGRWSKVEYIHKSENHVYFIDWEAQKDSFCMNDFYRRYCNTLNYKYYYDFAFNLVAEIHGKSYKFDYLGAVDGISEVVKIAV